MKRMLLTIMILMVLFVPAALAEGEGEVYRPPEIAGETEFNQTTSEIVSGSFSLDPVGIINSGIERFFKEIRESSDVMVTFIILAALSGILNVLQGSLKSKSSGETAFFACFTLMSAAAVKCFLIALGYGKDVITAMTDFVTKLSPVFMTLLLSSGKITSAAAFQPVLSIAVFVVTVIVKQCILPLTCFGAALSIVNNISGRVQISNFTSLVQSSAKWILTGVLTIFTAITAIYGFTAPALDSVGGKTVKFAVGSLVPVVGGLLSDAVETVVGGSMMMKNAVGTAGLITLCGICLVPIFKIGIILLMLKLSAAAVEPLTDRRITGMLGDVSSAVTNVFAMVITVAVMFLINVSIMMAVTN